jgi:transcription-repair coupling factor (superfamily II helicase)
MLVMSIPIIEWPLPIARDALRADGARVQISGLRPAAKAAVLSDLAAAGAGPLLVLTASLETADTLADDIRFIRGLGGDPAGVQVIPDWNPSFPPPIDLEARRVEVLAALLDGSAALTIAPLDAVKAPLITPSVFRGLLRTLSRGDAVGRENLIAWLVEAGYEMVSTVTLPGEAVVRGGIIDCFSPLADSPVRIELDGDDVASLRLVDPLTQRSKRYVDSVRLGPAPGHVHDDEGTLADYLPPSTILVIDEPEIIGSASTDGDSARAGLLEGRLPDRSAGRQVDRLVTLHSLMLPAPEGWQGVVVETPSPQSLGFGTPGAPLAVALQRLETLRQTTLVVVSCRTREQAGRCKTILTEHGVPASELPAGGLSESRPEPPAPVLVSAGDLSAGLYDQRSRLLLLTQDELLGKERRYQPSRRARLAPFLSSLDDLGPGDLVVHTDYGIGRYEGLSRMTMGGAESEFLVLRYLGGDKVYVPLDRLDLVQKYAGVEGAMPRMEALGGTGWVKTKQKVRRAIEKMATDLLDLYAARELAAGHAFSPDGLESREFAAGFEYEETPDQARAIAEVTADMERARPMDRLVCGDVGYGKTEVAMRAAFTAIMDHKQVAVLVPTTLLAQQHGTTFAKRFAAFPVRVEVMSRFRSPAEQRAVLAALADGQVDIVIGTHRLLQKDIVFRDLGLVVVDEEQRFGVRHKERFKELRKSVDVLTLTATPIPRTLQMSFAGARDLSLIETPPADRLAIRTTLSPFDPAIVQAAIRRELARDGQVFFVHNRVADIERLAEQIRHLVPEARLVVGHGQLSGHQLDRMMAKFLAHEADVLLSTTIIESGLDIPTANTIVINRADHFGLAELYQLRGRVGRSGRQAYAILLIPPGSALTDEAHRRLEALQEFTELGSGFKIAARDLEIRGAGNLLGAEQSGHIAAVGFDLYLKMIQEAVDRLRGTEPEPPVEPSLTLPVSAFLPETYIADAYHRLAFYKRLASADSPDALTALDTELTDRFGPPPEPARRLFQVMEIRRLARSLAVAKVEAGDRRIVIAASPRSPLPSDAVDALLRAYPRDIRFLSEHTLMVTHPLEAWDETFARLIDLLQRLGACDRQDAARH